MTTFARYYLKLAKAKQDKRNKKYEAQKRYWKRYGNKYREANK